jgi:hypothetical protein
VRDRSTHGVLPAGGRVFVWWSFGQPAQATPDAHGRRKNAPTRENDTNQPPTGFRLLEKDQPSAPRPEKFYLCNTTTYLHTPEF